MKYRRKTFYLFIAFVTIAAAAFGCGSDVEKSPSQTGQDLPDEVTENDPPVTEEDPPPDPFFVAAPEARCKLGFEPCEADSERLNGIYASRVSRIDFTAPVGDCRAPAATNDGLSCIIEATRDSESRFFEDIEVPTAEDLSPDLAFQLAGPEESPRIEVWTLEYKNGEPFISPVSVESGIRSRWGFDDVQYDETQFEADDGVIEFTTTYWGFPLQIVVKDAGLVASYSSASGSFELESATLTGYIEPGALLDQVESRERRCGPETYPTYCVEDTSCSDPCSYVQYYALLIEAWMFLAADLDRDEDGHADAITARFDLEFAPGVAVLGYLPDSP